MSPATMKTIRLAFGLRIFFMLRKWTLQIVLAGLDILDSKSLLLFQYRLNWLICRYSLLLRLLG
nr:hypothetical protein Iba_chr10fCG3720 [Ipomoea batatas]GMD81087.1 hypothetical protein Iba_scaffold1570576CG0010 [Ipomoea batatas]